MTREGIAEGLAQPAPPPEPDDLHLIALQEGTRVTEAAVLVPLIDRSGRVQVLFTQRTAHLDDHAGQISFPGGRDEGGSEARANEGHHSGSGTRAIQRKRGRPALPGAVDEHRYHQVRGAVPPREAEEDVTRDRLLIAVLFDFESRRS